jgi:DNA replication and repair protein RecF
MTDWREQSPEIARPAVLRLDLSDFRGYAALRLGLDDRPVVLTGPNGAGKTNLLEAVSFLAPGRGLRRARLSEIDRQPGTAPWAVAASLQTPRGPVRIGTGRDGRSETGERRLLRIDGGRPKSQAALAELVHLVWLTPQMDRLFLDGASARRRFLDRLVLGFDPGHGARLTAFERTMQERARLLEDGPGDPSWLKALEESMAADAIAIAAARREVVARLDQACADAAISAFPQPRLALEGPIDGWLAAMPALAAEDELRRRLAAERRSDAERGSASLGPHRSDLMVRHAATGRAAAQCSTGEQKALLIAIVLAYARLRAAVSGTPPILLLDEVAAHLDQDRRAALLQEIAAMGAQSWLTGTEPALFAALDGAAQFFAISDAAVVAARA